MEEQQRLFAESIRYVNQVNGNKLTAARLGHIEVRDIVGLGLLANLTSVALACRTNSMIASRAV